jgi:thioredoxin 2
MQPQIEHLTDASDEQALVGAGLSVIDFWAGWCGPCRMMAPQFEKAAALRPGYRFAKVDVDAAPGLAARFGIRSIPTLAVLRDGELVAMQAGVMGAEQLIAALDRLAGDPGLTGPRPPAQRRRHDGRRAGTLAA